MRRAREVHIADSLSGLEIEQLRAAARIADLGSGAGLPGLVLAAKLPDARIDLIESAQRKCDFLGAAIARMGLRNTTVVCERSESWAGGGGREAYDAVTARAVGRLATIAELASRCSGRAVSWSSGRVPAPTRRSGSWSGPRRGSRWRWWR